MLTLVGEQSEGVIIELIAWHNLLRLADRGGWQRQGTLHPGYTAWDGSYTACEAGQYVTRQDARAFGLALEHVLPDVPTVVDEDNKFIAVTLASDTALELLGQRGINQFTEMIRQQNGGREVPADQIQVITRNPYLEPLTYFGGTDRALLHGMIRFFRQGAFRIY